MLRKHCRVFYGLDGTVRSTDRQGDSQTRPDGQARLRKMGNEKKELKRKKDKFVF